MPRQSQASPPRIPTAPPACAGPPAQQMSPGSARRGQCPNQQDHLMATACLSLACWLLLHCPPSFQTGRRGAGWSLGEGASLCSLPAQWEGKCEGNLSPALSGRNNPSTSGKLAVSLSACAGCALASPAPACAGRGFLCHPPAPCPNSLRPTSQRAPVVAGTATLTISSLREQ